MFKSFGQGQGIILSGEQILKLNGQKTLGAVVLKAQQLYSDVVCTGTDTHLTVDSLDFVTKRVFMNREKGEQQRQKCWMVNVERNNV